MQTQELVEQEQVEEIDINSLQTNEKPVLNGQKVIIEDVKLQPKSEEMRTRDGKHVFRNVLLKVIHKDNGHEIYSGIRQYKDNGTGEWRKPNLWVDSKSAAADLRKTWCAHICKNHKDVSLKEFLSGLKGLTGFIETKTVQYDGKDYNKNVIVKFLEQQAPGASNNDGGDKDGN